MKKKIITEKTYCPKCDYPLIDSTYDSLEIRACPVCKGALADKNCLEHLVEDVERNLHLIPKPTASDLSHPECGGTFVTHRVHKNHDLHIDVCDHCQSVWFDYEELEYTDEIHDIANAKKSIEKPFRWFHGLFVFLTAIPLEFNARPRKFPWITLLLILINIAVFIAQSTHNIFFTLSLSFAPATTINTDWFISLLTSLFAHGNIVHLLGNMYFLYLFGDNVEDILGKWRYLAFYLFGGIFANFAVALFDRDSIFIGASGAITALMGAYLIYFRAAKISNPIPILWIKTSWRKVSPWVLIGLFIIVDIISVFTGSRDGIAHWAHLGGFVFGVIFALLTYNRVLENNKFLKFINQEKISKE